MSEQAEGSRGGLFGTGGRFSGQVDPIMEKFNESINFDKRMWSQDLRGSIAYAKATQKVGILTEEERDTIVAGLEKVMEEWAAGTFELKAGDEDIHTANERRLTEIIGPLGGKLHTGRSRNDQVATDTRLWIVEAERDILKDIATLLGASAEFAREHIDVLMAGYTHLQPAQPIRFAHWLMSHMAAIQRDAQRLMELIPRANQCPLGSGALAGNAFGVDREFLAKELGFEGVTSNSLDSVCNRDFVAEFLMWHSLFLVHLSQMAEDLIINNMLKCVDMADAYATGSSLMPQKKNPDALELLRGKAGVAIGRSVGLMATLKGLPRAYNKDLQEDKVPLFDAVDTVKDCLAIATGVVVTMKPNPKMLLKALCPEMLATDLADYLVRKGVPFRETHHISGACVRLAEEKEISIDTLTLQQLQEIDSRFEEDVLKVWNYEESVERKSSIGGTSKARVLEQIDQCVSTFNQHQYIKIIMGCATSKAEPYTANAGTEAEYKERFTDSKTLGQGEFGIVKLVTDKSTSIQLASKILNKGFTFKDNELYPPMDAAELKMEIDILKVLNGQAYNLLLESIYESPSKVYVVTEICSGGEMLEYAGNNFKEGLRTEDVSRMAFQLLSAVDHCDRYNILHRDIKPENIMFKSNSKDAELRLIDFGCATMDTTKNMTHQTFSGTPFYISPEVFQKEYTTKTDVFSVGVVLYVLVAGYPAEQLQAAFNLLHKSKRDLKSLPGMPTDMPETYFDMLDKLLTYRYKTRKSAGDMLEEDDFVLFHQEHGDDVATTTQMTKSKSRTSKRASMKRTASIVLSGTGAKAALAFGFTKFARALTTILATMLNHGDIKALLANVDEHLKKDDSLDTKLGVIKVDDLIKILESMGKKDCIAAIDKQKNVDTYKSYNYEYTLLKAFDNKAATDARNAGTGGVESSLKKSSAMGLSARKLTTGGGSSMRKLNMKKSRQAQSVYIRGI